ncbi:hypothetical protein BAUCODRAFT_146600 [Baudoinia panamericana UAMH 10762]|uniref:Uncharacterized protein n=1 Tax=Baudoinia panamericana (strain UAMH 10762) TaxID=717646 RepID=M2MMW1_BAUPA|nr:uncharacterized protein BAUCODRAFT_146600 [Baudoinia panamericana UAMH 10762]EMC98006.1 hypothetical protein BAUCODRAFT_146600 [Baudoinia panamericana UAMH 10762]
MATRRPMPEDWVPSTQIKIRMKPRDERVRLPRSVQQCTRPPPIRLLSPPTVGSLESPPLPFKETFEQQQQQLPRDPEVVDVAAPNSWPRRGVSGSHGYLPRYAPSPTIRVVSPSLYSRCSTGGRSEVSFGVLDYYLRAPSPDPSPLLPPPPAPAVEMDPAMEKFDFELVSMTPKTPKAASGQRNATSLNTKPLPEPVPKTVSGAENETQLIDVSPPPPNKPLPPLTSHKRGYSLFPTIKELPPRPGMPAPTPSFDARAPAPTRERAATTSIVPPAAPHEQPHPSYRPRKESLSSSIRSRKDSFTSFRCSGGSGGGNHNQKRIPLRILSSSSTASARTFSTASASFSSSGSPPDASRWSEDTITSPGIVTTKGPRTSFGSLLGPHAEGRANEGAVQYPACFFEDDEDDEAAPLRRKLGWTRTGSRTQAQERGGGRQRGRLEGRSSFGMTVKKVVLCGGCVGAGGGGK